LSSLDYILTSTSVSRSVLRGSLNSNLPVLYDRR
jgi:hypothetical protein